MNLTINEHKEFKQLSTKLFGNNSFVVFSKEEENSKDYKRYNELLNKEII